MYLVPLNFISSIAIGLKLYIELYTNSSFFVKFRVSFLDALSSGITSLTLVVCFPSPLDADVGKNRLRDQPKECLCVRQGAGTSVLCNFAIPFSQFYLSKAVFIYAVHSPRLIPCFKRSSQSAVRILYRPQMEMLVWGQKE